MTKHDNKYALNILYKVCVCRTDRKIKMTALALTGWNSTSRLEPLNGIRRNLTESKYSTSYVNAIFFGSIRKQRWSPWSLIDWDIFDVSAAIIEQNVTKHDRKYVLNILYQVCVLGPIENLKIAALALTGWNIFLLFLWNHWTEFCETWLEASTRRLLPMFFFYFWTDK